eukprot:6270240-Pyramimonas_sp.AAC.1
MESRVGVVERRGASMGLSRSRSTSRGSCGRTLRSSASRWASWREWSPVLHLLALTGIALQTCSAVVVRCKEELPAATFKQVIDPLLADAGMGPDSFVVEAEPLGKRCVFRFKGPPELGARRAAKVL